ncbi:MAG: RNA polymerase sigma factor [Planctomycetes bacterium]|nr:RNA polymerase sigma factor [Planctomycetota bacterium]
MGRSTGGTRADGQDHPAGIDAAEFCAQFQASFRVLWLIAAGTVGEASLADDVVQDAALIALGKLDDFQPGTNFTAWMGRVVRYVALNQARKERKFRMTTGDATLADGDTPLAARSDLRGGPLPAGRDDTRVFDQRIEEALQTVGEVARACLLLRTVEGLPYSDIAALLEIPEGTAMSHVHRTRRYLRGRLAVWQANGPAAKEEHA